MRLTISRPDDWHLHLRDGSMLAGVVAHTAARFRRAIVMPNLSPPVTTTAAALAYRDRILSCLPEASRFQPLMTLYLTDTTSAQEIALARESARIFGVKLYPAGATTHSDEGVTAIEHCYAALEAMQDSGMPLLVHGETTDPAVDIFDREKRFIDETLAPILDRFPDLKVVLEHITTEDAVEFVRQARDGVAATITPQHILLNRNALFTGGLRPHHYCLPVLKAERHREAVLQAAVSGEPRFFLGTDSAPHSRARKEAACGCAGVYSAHAGIELYAEAFEQAGQLQRLDDFASRHGADFYGLPRNEDTLTLVKSPWTPPDCYRMPDGEQLVPFRSGEVISWRLETP